MAVATTGGATPPGEVVGGDEVTAGVEPAAGPASGDPLEPARVTANTTTNTSTAATAAAIPMRRPRPGRSAGAGDGVTGEAGGAGRRRRGHGRSRYARRLHCPRSHPLEDLAVRRVEVEHGRGPLAGVPGEQALARTGDGLVDRHTVGQRGVELTGERGGGTVADGELHRNDRRAVLLDEPLGHAAERVGGAEPAGLARVEEHQPQRVVVVQVGTEDRGWNGDAAAVLVAEVEDTLLLALVEVPVPDDVQDVDLVRAQPRRELGRRG